jgi:hypothetical protein
MSRRSGRAGRPRHADQRTGSQPHDAGRGGRPAVPSLDAAMPAVMPAAMPAPIAPTTAAPPAPMTAIVAPPAIVAPLAIAAFPASAADEPTLPTVGRPAEPSPPPTQPGPSQPDPAIADERGAPTAPAERPIERSSTCTTAQLRRFIKSRAYLPIHEIRRRFLIAVEDDDVTGVQLGPRRIYVGLPPREAVMLGDLLRSGEVGYELQFDPITPVVVGVYPMRPVTRS